MANQYVEKILNRTSMATVIEDCIWEYGKKKPLAKVVLDSIITLQEPSPSVKVVKRSKGLPPLTVPIARNYIEIYLPDALFTYPVEGKVRNNKNKQTLFGASEKNPHNNGKNGEMVKGMYRIIEEGTKLQFIVVDGFLDIDNIKIQQKYDDYDPNNMGVKGAGGYGKDGNSLKGGGGQALVSGKTH